MATLTEAIELAGYFGAHAMWCVSDGETLVPMLAGRDRDGAVSMRRVESEPLERAVSEAREALAKNPDLYDCAVVLYDGFITLPAGKTDAILAEIQVYAAGQRVVLALPYRHASGAGGFAVFRPKVLTVPDNAGLSPEQLGEALFQGVAGHERGAALWSHALDESR